MFFPQKKVFFSSVFIFLIFSSPYGPNQIASGKTTPLQNSPNILLLTIDTLRPDHLGCYGYKSINTPNIDTLAQNGVLFTNAYSPAPITLPSHASIMTGQYPIRHGVHDNGIFLLTNSAVTLAEILKKHGYHTGAIIASYVLAAQFGLKQGFDYYNDHFNQDEGGTPKIIESYRKGKEVTELAQEWLQENYEKPFFLWVHFFDPHSPYHPPAPFNSQYENRPYDGEIAYLDQCLGDLFEKMQKLHLQDNTLIILAGDHGEGLWEHQEQTHGLFIYDTTIKVPLIFNYPPSIQKNVKVNSLASTIDIMPTILETFDIKLKKITYQGISLVPLLTGKKKKSDRNLYCASRYPELNFNWAPLEGIITPDGWKYIEAPKPELYNLTKDAHEKSNLYAKSPKKTKSLQSKLLLLKKDISLKSDQQEDAKQIALSSETRERLRSLGYIWSGESEEKNTEDQSTFLPPDPKDKAPLLAQIDQARELDAKGSLDGAIQKYEHVLTQDPENKMALYSLGLAYQRAGRLNDALVVIKKVVAIDPEYFNGHHILGLLYDQMDLPEEAIREYKEALRINPTLANAHNNLGMMYFKTDDLDSAIREFQKVFSLSPNSILASITHTNLGGVYSQQGNFDKATEKFNLAISINQNNREAHIRLADTFYHLNKIDQCINEWKKILAIWPDDFVSSFKLAKLFLIINKPNEAIIYLQKCLQLRPDFYEARMLLQQIPQKNTSL